MQHNLLLPIAGKAQRFIDKGWQVPKPLIMVSGRHIIDYAINSIDYEQYHLIFIVRTDHIYNFSIDKILKNKFGKNIDVVPVDKITRGSVESCLAAKELIDNNDTLDVFTPDITFRPIISPMNFDSSLDGALLTFKANSAAHSYCHVENNLVVKTAEKCVISDHANVGYYHFSYGNTFVKYADKLIQENITTNNEFYLSDIYNLMIQDGLKIGHTPINRIHILGTPEDVEFYEKYVNKNKNLPIALCSDHSGFELKEQFKSCILNNNMKFIDFGTYDDKSCDYSDFVIPATRAINKKECQFGFGFCRTGQGVNICANKQPGIMSALIYNDYSMLYSLKHNSPNFFSFAANKIKNEDISIILESIKIEQFEGGRHSSRIRKFIN